MVDYIYAKRKFIFIVWIVLQYILLIGFWRNMFESWPDEAGYINHANRVVFGGGLYPNNCEFFDIYIQSPGFVNFVLAPFVYIFNDILFIRILFVILNSLCLYLIYKIAIYFFNQRVAFITSLLYACLINNLFVPTIISTELPYVFLCLLGLFLSTKKQYVYTILAAFSFALAYTIRPLIIVYIIPIVLLWFFIDGLKFLFKRLCFFVCFISIPLFVYGIYNKNRVGYPLVTSVTGGANLILTGHDMASIQPNYNIWYSKDAGLSHMIWKDSTINAVERDKQWRNLAISHIVHNPLKYLFLCIKRPIVLFNKDTWAMSPILGEWDDGHKSMAKGMKYYLICQVIKTFYSLPYFVVCILFIINVYKRRNSKLDKNCILLLIFGLGILVQCLFPAEHRYHYPYLWIMCVYASFEFDRLLNTHTHNKRAKS